MLTRFLTFAVVILSLTLISDSVPSAAAPAAEFVYIVDSDQSQPDAILDGHCDTGSTFGNTCTLRAAIQEANNDGFPSRIKFASQMTISGQYLDPLVEPYTVIDASDQWDREWPAGEPGVRIIDNVNSDGSLLIYGNYAKVRGINFQGEGIKGIVVHGSQGTVIGGTGSGQRNSFSVLNKVGYPCVGVEIRDGATKTDVIGNFFGTVYGQKDFPCEYGVYVTSTDNTVRDNRIVAQTEAGILLWNLGYTGHNLIMDNFIGFTESNIVQAPNKIGIAVYSSHENQIGPGNEILRSTQEGILIDHSNDMVVLGNEIETNGGDGINIISSSDSWIGVYDGNTIRYNQGHGFAATQLENTNILQNQICTNTLDGINLTGSQNNVIGGSLTGQENIITKNEYGIHLGNSADNNTILGNHIGYEADGCGYGNNAHGILIDNGASNNQIGGLDPGEGNWIAKNLKSGIYITGSSTTGNVVEGNLIGAELDWSQPAPNNNHGIGIYDGANGNWIGWFNTILASGWSGVAIVNSGNNTVWLNYIGTDGADINWGNSFYGIDVVNSSNNQIFGNGIHNNGTHAGEPGVRIQGAGSVNNFISINSIHNNGGLGIELADGGNSNQPAPAISSGSCASGVTGTACLGCIVEIFSDTDDEGKFLEESVTADATTGIFSWTGKPAGPNITATASSAILGSTSQFSVPYNIGTCNNPPVAAFTYVPSVVHTCKQVTFDASTSSDVEDPGSALLVRWDWENDGTYDTTLDTKKTAKHLFSSPGLQTVRLEVQDTDGLTDATTQVVTVSACKRIFMPVVIR